jgi:bifunctional lysine-specific demethylase and histidyl-hydroxylase NO66
VAERVVKDVIAELTRFAAGLDAGELAADLTRRHRAARQPLLHGQLLELEHIEGIDDDTVVARRDGLVVTTELDGPTLRLRAGDRTIEAPAAIAPAVRRLLGATPIRAADLADELDDRSRLVLVRRLVREGLVRTVGGVEEAERGRHREGGDREGGDREGGVRHG